MECQQYPFDQPNRIAWDKNRKHTVSQLSDTNKPGHILIKDLESTTVLLRLAGLTETARAVEDFQERVEINCSERES